MTNLLAFLSGKKTYLTCTLIFGLLFGVWQKWWTVPPEIYAALFSAALVFIRLGVSKADPADPAAAAAPQPVNITKLTPLLVLFSGLLFFGCAHLQPGADPIVVNVERTETIAKSSFDLVLNVDNSKRDFFATNAPGFHNFCEWLRAPQTVEETNTLPRCSALLVSLDDVKLSYKAGRSSSNQVFTALVTVQSAMNQANSWLSSITNQPATR